jgi:hypothetical protein
MKKHYIQPLRPVDGRTRCSFLDIVYTYPATAFVYREKLDPARLARAMAQVLSDFPVFAGRLSWTRDGYYIDHARGGALLEVVDSKTPIQELASAATAGRPELVRPRVSVLGALFGRAPLLAVRLTTGPDGSVLGVTVNHVFDMTSVMFFMRAWALCYQDLPYEKPAAILDRDAYLAERIPDPPQSRSVLRIVSWSELLKFYRNLFGRSRRVDYEFSRDQIAAIHAAAASGGGRMSASDALSAHLFSVIRQVQGATGTQNLNLTVDFRKRVGIPANVLGNVTTILSHPVDAADSVAVIASGLRTKLEQFATSYVNYHATKRFLDAHRGWSKRLRLVPECFQPGRGDLSVVNWTNAGGYDLIFDTSGPSLILCLAQIDGTTAATAVIYDSPNRAGVTVALNLPRRLAERLDAKEGRALLLPSSTVQSPAAQLSAAAAM